MQYDKYYIKYDQINNTSYTCILICFGAHTEYIEISTNDYIIINNWVIISMSTVQ